jgi:hypothetical protein
VRGGGVRRSLFVFTLGLVLAGIAYAIVIGALAL